MSDLTDVLCVHRCADMQDAPLAVSTVLCDQCAELCWIAQTSIRLIVAKPGIVVMCGRCVAELDQAEVAEVHAVPGAVREINDLLAQDNYSSLRDVLERKAKR